MNWCSLNKHQANNKLKPHNQITLKFTIQLGNKITKKERKKSHTKNQMHWFALEKISSHTIKRTQFTPKMVTIERLSWSVRVRQTVTLQGGERAKMLRKRDITIKWKKKWLWSKRECVRRVWKEKRIMNVGMLWKSKRWKMMIVLYNWGPFK